MGANGRQWELIVAIFEGWKQSKKKKKNFFALSGIWTRDLLHSIPATYPLDHGTHVEKWGSLKFDKFEVILLQKFELFWTSLIWQLLGKVSTIAYLEIMDH